MRGRWSPPGPSDLPVQFGPGHSSALAIAGLDAVPSARGFSFRELTDLIPDLQARLFGGLRSLRRKVNGTRESEGPESKPSLMVAYSCRTVTTLLRSTGWASVTQTRMKPGSGRGGGSETWLKLDTNKGPASVQG